MLTVCMTSKTPAWQRFECRLSSSFDTSELEGWTERMFTQCRPPIVRGKLKKRVSAPFLSYVGALRRLEVFLIDDE